MKHYKKIYSFNVIDEIKNGKRVMMLDKQDEKVYPAGDVKSSYLFNAIESDEKERFEFWAVEESEEVME